MITIRYKKGEVQGDCIFQIVHQNEVICTFQHHNPDGLAQCLHKAADAVELSEWAEKVLLNEAKGG